MHFPTRLGFLLILILAWGTSVPTSSAQVSLSNLPSWTNNTRFATPAVPEVRHPSLGLNGFDCGSDCWKGLGLKQVLQKVSDANSDPSVERVFDEIVFLHDNAIVAHPNSRSQVLRNVEILQARAFVALATYVLEENNESISGLPSHATAAGRLKSALQSVSSSTLASWALDSDFSGDAVKWASHMSGLARAMDLYLALENAYCHYGGQGDATAQAECDGTTSNRLLSATWKSSVFASQYGASIAELEDLGEAGAFGYDAYDAQPGNWPLKVQVAVGTASMVMNDMTNVSAATLRGWVRRAMEASLRTAGTDRSHFWGYQTDDGKRFFAEGPYYFEFALGEVVPFWHALRVNDLLGYHGGFNAPDPFFTDRFTDPLDWLADLVTPDGQTPPLDDGNKHPIDVSTILRWTGSYGRASTGRKFAWIGDRYRFGEVGNLLTMEIAVPRLGVGEGTPPPASLGNTLASQTGEDGEQQVVFRRETTSGACDDVSNAGSCHYVLLNAESGDAYGRGEGHEQPDQAQLLYYIDGASVLMDSGYDSAGKFTNGTWSYYGDHNTMGITTQCKGRRGMADFRDRT